MKGGSAQGAPWPHRMVNHFTSIGIGLTDEATFNEFIPRAIQGGRVILQRRGSYIYWQGPHQIELWIGVNSNNEIKSVSPHFRGSGEMRVALIERIGSSDEHDLEGAFYGWSDPEEDCDFEEEALGLYPFVFECPDHAMHSGLSLPRVRSVQLAAFAHTLAAAAEAVPSNQELEKVQLSDQSFIPLGLFGTDADDPEAQPQPLAYLTGRIISAQTLGGPDGLPFWWLHVATYGGTIDVLADPSIISGTIVEGGVIEGEFWISGRILD